MSELLRDVSQVRASQGLMESLAMDGGLGLVAFLAPPLVVATIGVILDGYLAERRVRVNARRVLKSMQRVSAELVCPRCRKGWERCTCNPGPLLELPAPGPTPALKPKLKAASRVGYLELKVRNPAAERWRREHVGN